MSLPPATHGSTYTEPLAACGGTPPYKWKKEGKLPKGLKLSPGGILSGTPSVAGSYTVGVKVTDKGKPRHTATMTFSIVVM